MNHFHSLHPSYAHQAQLKATGRGDWAALDAMRDALRRHLTAALVECATISRDLTVVDADQLMTDLRMAFDPHVANANIQDAFSDAFGNAYSTLMDAGLEPITSRKTLASGVRE